MNEQENRELEQENQNLELESILREFSDMPEEQEEPILQEAPEAEPEEEETEEFDESLLDDTVWERFLQKELSQQEELLVTQRIEPIP